MLGRGQVSQISSSINTAAGCHTEHLLCATQFQCISFIPCHSPGGGYQHLPHFTNEETEVPQLESVRAGPRSQGSVSSVFCLDLSVSPLSLWCSPPFSHPPCPPV